METSEAAIESSGHAPGARSRAQAGALIPLIGGREWLGILALALVTGFLRLWRLSSPHEVIPLDETYYPNDARSYLRIGTEEGFAVHPPVAKWLIAGGMQLFGDRPFGWRFAAAVVGTLAVLVVYLAARRMWGTRFAAAGAAVIVATDGLFFVQSRISMLDIFLAFFILLGFWLLVEDYTRAEAGATGIRWWRIGSGVAFGLAVSSKWSGAFVLPVMGAIALAWEWPRIRRRYGLLRRPIPAGDIAAEDAGTPTRRPWARGLGALGLQAAKVAVVFALLPATVYLVSYTPWFFSTKKYVAPRCNETLAKAGGSVRTEPMTGARLWLCTQREIKDYHFNLKTTKEDGSPVHPYMSNAWSWPWIGRPAAHYYKVAPAPGGSTSSEIIGLPNPVTWVPAFAVGLPLLLWWAGLNWLVWRGLRRLRGEGRREEAWLEPQPDKIATLVLLMVGVLFLPWLRAARPLFLFYMTPAVPFLAFTVTHVLHRATVRWPWATWPATAYLASAVLVFAYFYPVLAALPIPDDGFFGWQAKMWMRGDCLAKTVKLFCWI